DPATLNKVSFSSRFSGSASSIAFKELSLGLDDTQVKGDASVVNFARPAITFGFGVNQINMDRYMPPAAAPAPRQKKKKGKPVTPETAGTAAAQLPIETLRGLDIDGKLLIGSLVYSNLKLGNVKLALKAKDGKIKLNPAQAELYQGIYDGNVALDASGKFPKLTMNTNFKGVQIEPLLMDYQGTANLKGKSDINLALFSAGSDVTTLKRNLNGQGGLKISNGVFQGVDVRRVLTEVEMMIEDKVPGKPTEGGETAFDRMTASLDIKGGVVSNKDLILSAPGIKVSGKGMLADLNNETWNYNLVLAVDESTATNRDSRYNIGGYSIPVHCSGLIKDKRCVPNVGDILATILEKAVTDKLLESVGVKKKKGAPASTSGGKEKVLDPGAILEEGFKDLFGK
ncbi:MAG: AsmA family protein, partial [Thiotrichales bacterium]|nr:AsmA family protein [Thiotrichales bacterium]